MCQLQLKIPTHKILHLKDLLFILISVEAQPSVDFEHFFGNLSTGHGLSQKACVNVAKFVRKACIQAATEARVDQAASVTDLSTVVSCSKFVTRRSVTSCNASGCDYIAPVTVDLGKCSDGARQSYQYISIIDLLTQVFKHQEVCRTHFSQAQSGTSSVISDFSSGALHCGHLHELQIVLYVDDFQVSNPLGNKCKKYKLRAFYCRLGYPQFQSQLKHIFLLSLLRASYFKQYRSTILGRLTDELKVLENVGISVTHDN